MIIEAIVVLGSTFLVVAAAVVRLFNRMERSAGRDAHKAGFFVPRHGVCR
jgi:hypothetical protein